MTIGTVKTMNNARGGFGFIKREDGPDVYVSFHVAQMCGLGFLRRGDRLEFDVRIDARDRLGAVHIKRLD